MVRINNSLPKNWKNQINQFKSELQEKYGASNWSRKAKAGDFVITNGVLTSFRKPINNRLETIESLKRSMSIQEAESRMVEGDYLRVQLTVKFKSNDDDKRFNDREIQVSLPLKTKLDISWIKKLIGMLDKDSKIPKSMYRWLNDKFKKKWGADSADVGDWYVPQQSIKAFLIKKNTPVAGPARRALVSNCAIEVIAHSMGAVDTTMANKLDKLRRDFHGPGVWPDDYPKIAKFLGCNIKVTFAPSNDVAKQWMEKSNLPFEVCQSFGCSKRKTISVHHWNGHATAMSNIPVKRSVFVTETEMVEAMMTRFDSIHQIGDNHTTFRSDIDGSLEMLQYSECDGVQLTLGVTSPQMQLFNAFASQISPFGYKNPNIAAYDSFVKHGIHWSNGNESRNDIDFDLTCAYSSYMNLTMYRGLPQDITWWVNNPTIDQVQIQIGFVLTTFTDPIKGIVITQWLACPAVVFLSTLGLVIEMKQAAFAQRTFHLNTSEFIQPGVIGKRVFHKIVGLSTLTTSNRSFISNDFIGLSKHYTSKMQLPQQLAENYPKLLEMSQNYSVVTVTYPSTDDRVSHVAATIQDYVTCEVWRKWVEVKSFNPRAQIVTCLVDGFRVNREGMYLDTFEYDEGRWTRKECKFPNKHEQCDWLDEAPLAIVATNNLMVIDFPIQIKPEYKTLVSSAYDGHLSFNQLAEEGWVHSIQGYAGSGKTTESVKIPEQSHVLVVTPTHSTREDMSKRTIRNYLTDESLQTIPCRTFQSVIQRPGLLSEYSVILVDEAGMLLASDLNRLAHIAGRKVIILVGDPAQHKPIKISKMYLEAKYLVFENYIKANDKLAAALERDDWERNQMIQKLAYDCDFVEPEFSDEIDADVLKRMREEHIKTNRHRVSRQCDILSVTFDYTLDRDVDAFDTYTGGKFLDVVRRVDESPDGKALAEFSKNVRENHIQAVFDLCDKHPEHHVYPHDACITNDITNTVIAYRNKDVDSYNSSFRETLLSLSNVDKSIALQTELTEIIENGTEIESEAAAEKMLYAYVDVDIAIVARKTMRYVCNDEVVTVYNGSRGVIRNFIIYWDGHKDYPMPFISVSKSKKTNEDKLKVANINPLYGITSYRVQGRTITDGLIYIDCKYYTPEMIYVAVSRATKLSQIRFVFDRCDMFDTSSNGSTQLVSSPDGFSLGFIPSRGCTLLCKNDPIKIDNLRHDWNGFDWFSIINAIDNEMYPDNQPWIIEDQMSYDELKQARKFRMIEYAQRIEEYIYSQLTNARQIKQRYHSHPYACDHVDSHNEVDLSNVITNKPSLLMIEDEQTNDQLIVDQPVSTVKQWSQADTYWFRNLQQNAPAHCSGPYFNSKRPGKVSMGHDICTYEFCVRVERNGLRAFYWFIGSNDMIAFNKKYTDKYNNIECHEIIVERTCGYFIDLDFKISNADVSNYFESIPQANQKIARVLNEAIYDAADELGWEAGIKTCISERSRQLDVEYSKISLHIYTNVRATFAECKEITDMVKQIVANKFVWANDMLTGIDNAQYHLNGSLAMPGGYKNGIKSTMLFGGYEPLLSVCNSVDRNICYDSDDDDSEDESFYSDDDEIDSSRYQAKTKQKSIKMNDLLNSIDECRFFSQKQMFKELSWMSADGKTGLITRKSSGHCNCCNGHHDNDNTLRVFITETGRFGAVCTRGGTPTYWE